jgi:myo-inositol-1(or 4)-monophosphatase
MIDIVKEGLLSSSRLLAKLGRGARQEVVDERTVDISTRGDRAVSAMLVEYFRKSGIPSALLSEESGEVPLSPRPEYTIVFDDIDGTDNYYRGEDILPYCTVIAILAGTRPTFSQTIAAGIIEHRSGTIWLAQRGGGTTVNGEPAAPSKRQLIDRRTVLAIDHYSAGSSMPALARLYGASWIKDFGSAALHLAGVSSGLFDGYISLRQKGHELAAGYLLISEAGGSITDLSGKSFADRPYEFSGIYEALACGNKVLAGEARALMGGG